MELVGRFDGTAIGDSWSVFPMQYDEESSDAPIGDFPSIYLPHIPVFSYRAAEALSPLLKSNGELLPLRADHDDYFAFNVTALVPALSTEQSDIVYYPSGRVMDVKKYVFDSSHLGSQPIFKVPETALMDVFVNHEFASTVDRHQLRGFSLSEVTIV